jgi:hypothetical protein
VTSVQELELAELIRVLLPANSRKSKCFETFANFNESFSKRST